MKRVLRFDANWNPAKNILVVIEPDEGDPVAGLTNGRGGVELANGVTISKDLNASVVEVAQLPSHATPQDIIILGPIVCSIALSHLELLVDLVSEISKNANRATDAETQLKEQIDRLNGRLQDAEKTISRLEEWMGHAKLTIDLINEQTARA